MCISSITKTVAEVTFLAAAPYWNSSQPIGGFVEAACFATLRFCWNIVV
jgi:hypothetical protein